MVAKNGYQVLSAAIAERDPKKLGRAMQDQPDAIHHWKPITDAAFVGDPECMQLLLDAGADPNVHPTSGHRHTPLTRLTQFHKTIPKHEGHAATLKILLDHGADLSISGGPNDLQPLAYASMGPYPELIDMIVTTGLKRSIFVDAILLDSSNIEKHTKQSHIHDTDDQGRTALHYVALSGMWRIRGSQKSIECASLLLASGLDLNATQAIPEGNEVFEASALWWAISWQGHTAFIEYLLDQGASTASVSFTACHHGDVEICELLDKQGIDWDETFDSRTPLMDLLQWNRPRMVGWLLDHGADIAVQDSRGRSALHYAAERGVNIAIIDRLIASGADTTLMDRDGKTPLDLARAKKRRQAIEVLTTI